MKVVHIINLEKFIPSFIDLIRRSFCNEQHYFITRGDKDRFRYQTGEDSFHVDRFSNGVRLLVGKIYSADKIVLHGFYDWRLGLLLALIPGALKKTYWTVWGWDLYQGIANKTSRNIKIVVTEEIRAYAIRRFRALLTHISGDFELAKELYSPKGSLIYCLLYPSNLALRREFSHASSKQNGLVLLVGNSADPSNNHIMLFDLIRQKLTLSEIDQIIVPLSYGPLEYRDAIIDLGYEIFGDKFYPLRDFLPFDDYASLISKVDIALWGHDRQQALGNTITLLGMGKTVYMNEGTTTYKALIDVGLTLRPLSHETIGVIDKKLLVANSKIIQEQYSEEKLVAQWKNVFDD